MRDGLAEEVEYVSGVPNKHAEVLGRVIVRIIIYAVEEFFAN